MHPRGHLPTSETRMRGQRQELSRAEESCSASPHPSSLIMEGRQINCSLKFNSSSAGSSSLPSQCWQKRSPRKMSAGDGGTIVSPGCYLPCSPTMPRWLKGREVTMPQHIQSGTADAAPSPPRGRPTASADLRYPGKSY